MSFKMILFLWFQIYETILRNSGARSCVSGRGGLGSVQRAGEGVLIITEERRKNNIIIIIIIIKIIIIIINTPPSSNKYSPSLAYL